jgi:hypothetical protein
VNRKSKYHVVRELDSEDSVISMSWCSSINTLCDPNTLNALAIKSKTLSVTLLLSFISQNGSTTDDSFGPSRNSIIRNPFIINIGSKLRSGVCYKSEGRRFDSSWCQWIFFIDIKSFRSHYAPGVDSASNRNEYQEYFLGVKAAGA